MKKIFAQYEIVRRSGQTNMFDMDRVGNICADLEFYDLYSICANAEAYGSILEAYAGSGVADLSDIELETVAAS